MSFGEKIVKDCLQQRISFTRCKKSTPVSRRRVKGGGVEGGGGRGVKKFSLMEKLGEG